SDHFLQAAVDHEGVAGAEVASAHLALPVSITDYRFGRRACSRLTLGQDQPPSPGPDSEHAEKLTADVKPVRASQIAPLPDTHVVGAPPEHAREGLMVLPDLLPHWSRQLPIGAGIDAHTVVPTHDPHFGELFRV